MGIFRSIANKLKKDESLEAKNPPSEKRQKYHPYKTAGFVIPDYIPSEDLAKVLKELVRKKILTKNAAGNLDATRRELANRLEDLVAQGEVTKEVVDFYMEGIIAGIRERIKITGEGEEYEEEDDEYFNNNEKEKLLTTLKARFEKHNKNPQFKKLRSGIEWEKVQDRLETKPEKLLSLYKMEETGGEPDVIGFDNKTGEYIFWDLSKECPLGRKDQQAFNVRYQRRDFYDAIKDADEMGVKLLSKSEYGLLQKLGQFDVNTWTWLETPEKKLKTGQAYCGNWKEKVQLVDARRKNFVRGFRGSLRV